MILGDPLIGYLISVFLSLLAAKTLIKFESICVPVSEPLGQGRDEELESCFTDNLKPSPLTGKVTEKWMIGR